LPKGCILAWDDAGLDLSRELRRRHRHRFRECRHAGHFLALLSLQFSALVSLSMRVPRKNARQTGHHGQMPMHRRARRWLAAGAKFRRRRRGWPRSRFNCPGMGEAEVKR